MSGKIKTLAIIAGMIVVYFIALNMVLRNSTAALRPGSAGTAASEPASGRPGGRGGITGELAVGNVVTFGSYEQDADFSNGKEPLEWDVIGQKGDSYLLITHYVIDGKKFDDSSSDNTLQANENKTSAQVTWAKSSIRAWLNADFYTETFTKEEQAIIRQTRNETTDFRSFDTGYLGFASNTSEAAKANSLGGDATNDSVFLLSYEEFVAYFQPEKAATIPQRMQCGRAIVSPTKYARNQGVSYRSLAHEAFCEPANIKNLSKAYLEYLRKDVHEDYEENDYVSSWITRLPGCYADGIAVMMILSDYTCFSPSALKNEVHGIRPAIWVQG
ncbi:MAG: hypothetical protein K2P41_11305 [Lachnospiraceae bacterium]|nr:hypothetical protein [Lachnospiraceae bacterium]